jgi:hypothetical protein
MRYSAGAVAREWSLVLGKNHVGTAALGCPPSAARQ